MTQSIDLDAWRKDGKRLWTEIQDRKLVVLFWNNPWFRLAAIGSAFLVAAVATWLIWRYTILSGIMGAISLPFLFTAIKYFVIGQRTGGLYSFFSENGFGVGCDADRLSIPYSSIQLPERVNPSTVNENYLILPARADKAGVIVEGKNGVDTPWDGTPYTRGIVSVFVKDGALHVKAFPNEMLVHLFCAIYPLSLYFASQTNPAGENTD